MQQTIKTCQSITSLVCLAATLAFSGCHLTHDKTGSSDSTATDSAKKDSAVVTKKDPDSTVVKKTDSVAPPVNALPKIDTGVKHRPIPRKTTT